MSDVLNILATDWGLLRFVAGFIVLPLVYLRDRTDVHKDYVSHASALMSRSEFRVRHKTIRRSLHVFELEWWFVVAVSVVFVGCFFLGGAARMSGRFRDRSDSEPASGAIEVTIQSPNVDPLMQVEGMLNAYGLGLALLALFYVKWAKAEFYRSLHADWLSSAQSTSLRSDASNQKIMGN